MNVMKLRNVTATLTLVMCLAPAPQLFAQAEGGGGEVAAAATFTQGQMAVIMAQRLGLNSSGSPLTEARAIQLLVARGIAPKGGWNASAALAPGDVARTLVQALGLEAELSEAQIAGDDDQPFIDLLVEMVNVDVRAFASASALDSALSGGNPNLVLDPSSGSATGGSTSVVSESDFDSILDAIVGPDQSPQAPNESTFTLELSDGRLFAITLNDQDDNVVVRAVSTGSGPVIRGDEIVGDSDDFVIPRDIISAVGRFRGPIIELSQGQATNLGNAIRALNPGIAEVNVPTDTITVSPSS